MKRKGFLIVLVLVLSVFFLSNILSVDAILYKVLDGEGKLIRLTNEPVLSVSEKGAGYTLDPPIEGLEEKIFQRFKLLLLINMILEKRTGE